LQTNLIPDEGSSSVAILVQMAVNEKYVSSWGESKNDEGTKLYRNTRGQWPKYGWKKSSLLFLEWSD
jgi:hypothetical protein